MMDEKNGSTIFRAKSLQRVSSPEQSDDYLCLPTPSVWFAAAAALLLGCGALVWLTLGAV